MSVLFADLAGVTGLSEERDAEDVREVLTRYFDVCRQVIGRYGGRIEKFVGDAVMALWGAPVAHEDDAERAVRAALELVGAVEALGCAVDIAALRLRAGVLTGEAAVTPGGGGDGMVAGDLVNTASRVQSLADAGAVFVGESTRRATRAAVAYEDAGEHPVKGKAGTLRVWRALRVTAGLGGAMRAQGLEAPFVGRDRELRLVKELLHACSRERRSHLVLVSGIAGIGKSRLGWELFKYADGIAETVRWHRGRCLAYGDGVTYWALAEMVRVRARITEGEPAESVRAKLAAALDEHVPDPQERAWMQPRLAHLLGLEEWTSREREDLFPAWRIFFERISEQGPVVLLFEDLQWADAALLEFVEHLLEWARDRAIYVLALARPELSEHHPEWAAGLRNFTTIALEPLGQSAMQGLLEGLVPGLPVALREQILARAEGVPLYAMETVRMLLDRGLLERAGETYRPTGPVGALEVPETLHALIAARLDGLAGAERALLQDAAVLGKTFSVPALAALAGAPAETIEPLLRALVRKEVLWLHADVRSPDRGRYGFLQDLVRHVAYQTLARSERRARHLAAAKILRETWGGEEREIVEVLAAHYLQAYRADTEAADAGTIKVEAREMLVRAAERAASLAAADDALRYFEQAAELTDEPLARAAVLERAGEMARRAGRPEQAQAHLEQALALLGGRETHAAARASARLGEVFWSRGKVDEALACMQPAYEVLAAEEP
ncbi:MAG TPA: AAA family ATPase, partial [Solirubrobacteraceae bacterium]